jgi:hypothetical protein
MLLTPPTSHRRRMRWLGTVLIYRGKAVRSGVIGDGPELLYY